MVDFIVCARSGMEDGTAMRWFRWGLTLEAGGFSVLVVGLVAVLLFVPACPVC